MHFAAGSEHSNSATQVHQFAHVTGPVVGRQQLACRRCQRLALDTKLLRSNAQVVTQQVGDVLAARAQRWQLNTDDIEPMEQILAEQPLLDALSPGAGGLRQ